MIMKTIIPLAARSFLLRLAAAAAMIPVCRIAFPRRGSEVCRRDQLLQLKHHGAAAGLAPRAITYYTDQGDLSPILPNASANSFVASAFSVWTSVPTAAITVTSGGQLAEDVNGTNVIRNADGTISMPADIQPTATGTPVGIVYDYDGSVTDALIGSGAGDSSECFSTPSSEVTTIMAHPQPTSMR